MMMLLQFLVVLLFIFIGARLGGIGIGFAGGAGVILLGLLGLTVDPSKDVPWDVIGIISAVIAAIAALQVAGGLDYLVMVTERFLRKNPKRITFLAPIVTYFMTVFCGTGHVAFSSLPVIAEVAKESGVRPSRPLTISVVASQIAISASPISAAMIAMTAAIEPLGVSYMETLLVAIPSTFIGVMVGALVASRMGVELNEDPVYQERVNQGLVKHRGEGVYTRKPGDTTALWIFCLALLAVIFYATAISDEVGLIKNPPMPRNAAIMTFMFAAALLITLVCKIPVAEVTNQSTFKGGMSAVICIMGVAWLGNTFVSGHLDTIKQYGGDVIQDKPLLLAVVLFFTSALLYSQGATTATLMPVAASMGVASSTMLASFPAVTGLYLLPTYPTTVAAIEMDDTGTTRIGKYVFNHPFLLPGVISVIVSVIVGFILAPIVL